MNEVTFSLKDVKVENIIAGLALFTTIIIGMAAIFPKINDLKTALESSAESMRSSHYAELDEIYMKILLVAIDKPFLRQPDTGRNELESQQYDTYAFLVWNFLESIRDRSATDKILQRTWGPIVVSEALLHWNWFFKETTGDDSFARPKFCIQFCELIHRRYRDKFKSLIDNPENDSLWKYEKLECIDNPPWYCSKKLNE